MLRIDIGSSQGNSRLQFTHEKFKQNAKENKFSDRYMIKKSKILLIQKSNVEKSRYPKV